MIMEAHTFRNFSLLLLCLLPGSGLLGQSTATDRFVTATLWSEQAHIQPGSSFTVALQLDHKPGWHTYWQSSATGYATSIEWDLPEGFKAGPIQWPTPETYVFEGYVEYVYEGNDNYLLVDIQSPDTFDGDSLELRASVEWLMCEKTCIPGDVELALALPVLNAPAAKNPKTPHGLFEAARRSLPREYAELQLSAIPNPPSTVTLRLEGDDLPLNPVFFDAQLELVPQKDFEVIPTEEGGMEILLSVHSATNEYPTRLKGVLAGEFTQMPELTGIPIDLPIEQPVTKGVLSFNILLIAFFGGLILNLMPCVFPVIGVKILGFVEQAGADQKKVVLHGATFSLGVLLSFWFLAGLLILLRAGGDQLGWGYQLQSPTFIFLLAIFLFIFALSMSGLFEFGQSAVGIGSNATGKSGLTGSFFSGVLATVVATPCAAPLLAPALGAALTLSAFSSLVVFTFIALGLAAPYLLLSAFPSLLNRLPRPGPWMETLKQGLAFLLYATVAFLLWVLLGQLGEEAGYTPFASLKALFALVLTALAAWVFGRFGAYHLPTLKRRIGMASALVLLILAIATGLPRTAAHMDDSISWQKWEPGLAEELAADGHMVYVDFTARWCVTCQTNKAAVFSSNKIRDFIQGEEVVLLKADWTNRDDSISRELARFNRSAVPFNLVYGPALPQPTILPELLTPGIVLDALESASVEKVSMTAP